MSVTPIKSSFDQMWHHSELEEVIQLLESHPQQGLSTEEVARRQAHSYLQPYSADFSASSLRRTW